MLRILPFIFVLTTLQVSVQSRERRKSLLYPREITVTLKITRDRKPIAPSYTTKVPRGTLLVDILNKAAGDDTKGPFNKYESIYYGGTYKGVLLGYYLTAMDGIKQDPATRSYWMIIDEKSGDYTPCGVSSYVPGDCSTTIFDFSPLKLDKRCPPYGGSGYCKKVLPSGRNPQIYTQLKIFEKTGKFIFQGLDSYNSQDCYFMAFRLAADTSLRTVEPTNQAITMDSGQKSVRIGLGTLCVLAAIESLLFSFM